MALLKVTAANALATVRQLTADLRKVAGDAGPVPAVDGVVRGLDALEAYCAGRELGVEVLRAGALGPDTARRIASWIGGGLTAEQLVGDSMAPVVVERPGVLALRVRGRAAERAPAIACSSPRAPLLIVLTLTPGTLDDAARGALETAAQERPAVLVVGPPSPDLDQLQAQLATLAPVCEKVTLETLTDNGLIEKLCAAPWDVRLDVLRAQAAVPALDASAAALGLGLDQQLDELKIRHLLAQQRSVRFQQKGPSSAPAELLAQAKGRVQRLFAEFERGASERLQDLLGQPTGALTREIDARLNGLSDLEHEARTATMATRVAPKFEQELTVLLRERVGRHLMADVVALNDLFRLLGQEVERLLAEADGPPLVLRFDYLTEDRVRKLLATHTLYQSSYRGEMPRPGFGEYFASVRKYAMILVMGASMFGLSSVVRTYREFTIPITVMLVLFGTSSVVISTRTQRTENLETEIENARGSMRAELRRILSELQKQWSTALSQHLSEQATSVIEQIDTGFKSHQVRKDQAALPERERLQRQLQSIEGLAKKLPAVLKAKDGLLASLVQVRHDLRGVLAGVGAPGRVPLSAARAAAAQAAAGAAAAPSGASAAAAAAESAPSPARERLAALQAKVSAAREAAHAGAATPGELSPARAKLAALKARMAASKGQAPPDKKPPEGASS